MQLKVILNHVEKQKAFAYQQAKISDDKRQILIDLKPHGRKVIPNTYWKV